MDDLQPGAKFGNYTLELRLGGGGFGSVWRAKDNTSGQTVALKILVGKFSSGDVGRTRSEVELLAAAASSDSPNVVRVLGGGTEPSPHVVMEFIEGHDLEHELDQRTKLPQDETLRIVRAVAEALAVLEKAGIIHRDVKPANVMLADDGTIKLTDFGIAKIAGYESVTATGQLPLSAAYAAPEVWGGEATYQSDFYALGAVAFQCLTGSRPFAGTFVQLYEYHKTRPPDWALLPGDTVPALRQLMVSCLAKEPSERPGDSAALLALVGEGEAELARHAPDGATTVAGHEPRALGPWLIESKHESQPWAFRCLHETMGEHATVEVHFSDSLELGEQIKRAVMANPTLVPLGAERLLGTNRLILRPGETWPNRPPGQFMFWVARQELPVPRAMTQVSADQLSRAADALLALIAAGEAMNVHFPMGVETTVVHAGGVLVTRPGLPPYSRASPRLACLILFESLPLDPSAAVALDRARDLEGLASPRSDSVMEPAYGVATPSTSRADDERGETEVTSIRRMLTEVTRPPMAITPKPEVTPIESSTASQSAGTLGGTGAPPAALPPRVGPPTALPTVVSQEDSRGYRRGTLFGEVVVGIRGIRGASWQWKAAAALVGLVWLLGWLVQSGGDTSRSSSVGVIAGSSPLSARDAPALRSISTRHRHTCGIRLDGTIACWGQNTNGEASPPPGQYVYVSTGVFDSCAISTSGGLDCWGETGSAPSGLFSQVSAGYGFDCAVRTDEVIVCWGSNQSGRASPPNGNFKQVSTGRYYSCGLRTDGHAVCWGDFKGSAPQEAFAQISVGLDGSACGVTVDSRLLCWNNAGSGWSTQIPGNFVEVSDGDGYACGLSTDGHIACWGRSGPAEGVPTSTFLHVSAGGGDNGPFACGVQSDGLPQCWGNVGTRETAPPTSVLSVVRASTARYERGFACGLAPDQRATCWGDVYTGVTSPPPLAFKDLAVGDGLACGVGLDGAAVCWGGEPHPLPSFPEAVRFKQLSAGTWQVCGVTLSGGLLCTGKNPYGATTPPVGTYTKVSVGYSGICALRADAKVACWGPEDSASNLRPPDGQFLDVETNGGYACGIRIDHRLTCWGRNSSFGSPALPSGAFQQLTIGQSHACALTAEGHALCWGSNGNGQSSPPQEGFQQLSASDDYTCGLRIDGAVVCWGWRGNYGPVTS